MSDIVRCGEPDPVQFVNVDGVNNGICTDSFETIKMPEYVPLFSDEDPVVGRKVEFAIRPGNEVINGRARDCEITAGKNRRKPGFRRIIRHSTVIKKIDAPGIVPFYPVQQTIFGVLGGNALESDRVVL